RRYKIAIGHQDKIKPANIVGAIANEAELESRYIGHIDIFEEFSTVDLPEGMPKETFRALKNAWVCGKKLNISELSDSGYKSHKQGTKNKSPTKPTRKKRLKTKKHVKVKKPR
ncbi:MAG: ATP-dependent helicase, partial [Gammaproteobacteria bacterium]